MIKENLEQFFIVWGILLLLNQIFIFGGCFEPYCIGAALPHTGIISALLILFAYPKDDEEDEISNRQSKPGHKDRSSKENIKIKPNRSFKKEGIQKKKPPHPNWNGNYYHIKTNVQYKKFQFDSNGWSTEKVYLPYSNTDEFINIVTGNKYNKFDVDYYGKKKKQAKPSSQKKNEEQHTSTQRARQNNKNQYRKEQEEKSFTKKLGDDYEKYIGTKFEEKGDVVIYNGFIKGYEDKGVDIITISQKSKTINLIQCKNWKKKPMILDDVENIFYKLADYELDFFDIEIEDINRHLINKQDGRIIQNLFSTIKFDQRSYQVRKVLYASSERVIDLEIGKHLKMIKPNIFRYEDMKIVIHRQSK